MGDISGNSVAKCGGDLGAARVKQAQWLLGWMEQPYIDPVFLQVVQPRGTALQDVSQTIAKV